jgi:6-phosphogluconolactonase
MEVRVLDDPAHACAEMLCDAASASSHIVLTGGSTPAVAYQQAAGMGADWSGTALWFSDERCVPPEDELSNYRLAKESLLDRLDGELPEVHRIPAERGPHVGADDYEVEIRERLGQQMPQFDFILLGLGPDAHVASMFPGHATLEVTDRPVVGEEQAGLKPFVPRVTLTLPVLCGGQHIVFLVTGADKADAVDRAFGDHQSGTEAPGSLVRPRGGRMTVLLDAAAAGRLQP